MCDKITEEFGGVALRARGNECRPLLSIDVALHRHPGIA